MKIKCSLLVALIAVVTLVVVYGTKDSGNRGVVLTDSFPRNTLVIRNYSSNHLEILRDGVLWGQSRNWNGNIVSPQTIISPGEVVTFHTMTSNIHERATLVITAVKMAQEGCVMKEKTIWRNTWTLDLATNSLAQIITIQKSGSGN
jgi:hypothetical protein